MKNQFFLMIIFCSISNVVYSMSIDLDEASKAKLIEQVKKENVDRKYWPRDVDVQLKEFCMMPGDKGPEYLVRAVGFYYGYKQVAAKDPRSGAIVFLTGLTPVKISKGTKGAFRKEELESFGIQLPE